MSISPRKFQLTYAIDIVINEAKREDGSSWYSWRVGNCGGGAPSLAEVEEGVRQVVFEASRPPITGAYLEDISMLSETDTTTVQE